MMITKSGPRFVRTEQLELGSEMSSRWWLWDVSLEVAEPVLSLDPCAGLSDLDWLWKLILWVFGCGWAWLTCWFAQLFHCWFLVGAVEAGWAG